MVSYRCGRFEPRFEHHLYGLCALVILGCLMYIWHESHAYPYSLIEVTVPFALSLGLGIYTYRFNTTNTSTAQSKLMTKYGWAGALFAGAIGASELAFYVSSDLPINSFPDKFLSFVSIGLVTGVIVGRVSSERNQSSNDSSRDRVLVESSWIDRPENTPVVATIVDALAECENIGPLEVDPLYYDIDPEVFTYLRTTTGTPCQITVYLDDYEIRASSHGTVTIYEPDPVSPEKSPEAPTRSKSALDRNHPDNNTT